MNEFINCEIETQKTDEMELLVVTNLNFLQKFKSSHSRH